MGVTPEMKEVLKSLHGDASINEEHEARICMVNTLLGDSFQGVFSYLYDTREEAHKEALRLSKYYDVACTEDEEEQYFMFETEYAGSIFHGISAKLSYLE